MGSENGLKLNYNEGLSIEFIIKIMKITNRAWWEEWNSRTWLITNRINSDSAVVRVLRIGYERKGEGDGVGAVPLSGAGRGAVTPPVDHACTC